MSFLSKILKVAPIAASFIPGIGPLASGGMKALTKGIDAAGAVGQIAGAQEGGRAEGRARESQLLDQRDQTANQQYGIHQNAEMNAGQLDLDRQKFSQDARGTNAKQSLIASMLGGGFQPTSINTPGIKPTTIGGGLAASLGSDGAKQSMAELMKQSLQAQMAPDSFKGGNILTPNKLSAVPEAGKMDSFLSALSGAGSLAGAIGGMTHRSPYVVPPLSTIASLSGQSAQMPEAQPSQNAGLEANQDRLFRKVQL